LESQGGDPLLKRRCGESNKRNLLLGTATPFEQWVAAQRICAISSNTDKNSSHSFAKLSAWWVRALHASGLFERRYGRDALNNTFGECVVAKANEAD